MSNNKTCGKCKFFAYGDCKKIKDVYFLSSTNIACIKFEAKNPTNSDRIRQMSNEELVEFKRKESCFFCAYYDGSMERLNERCRKPANKTCNEGILAWLNAPADAPDKESEAKDE